MCDSRGNPGTRRTLRAYSAQRLWLRLHARHAWLVDQGGDQVTELDNGNWAHSNIWAGGNLTATYDTKGIHYELSDPLGTKRVQANALGQVDETCTSLPFGNDVGNPIGANCTLVANSLSTADDATEHHFTHKERDNETGNDYFFARYYASALGLTNLPSRPWREHSGGIIGGIGDAELIKQMKINNLYRDTNPVGHTDSNAWILLATSKARASRSEWNSLRSRAGSSSSNSGYVVASHPGNAAKPAASAILQLTLINSAIPQKPSVRCGE